MSKSITGITNTEIFPYYAVELFFDDENDTRWNQVGYAGENVLRFWTGYYDLDIDGDTYNPTGNLMVVSLVEESADLSAKSASLSLNGLNSTIVSLALTEAYQGRLCNIYFGVVGSDPVQVFSGFMDVMSIEDSGETSVISLTVESRLAEFERTRPFRYTDESHRRDNPDDSFFSFVASLADKQIVWGRDKA